MLGNKTKLLYVAFCFGLISCSNRTDEINAMLTSKNSTEIISGCNQLGENQDTVFVALILNESYDSRISHYYKYKGMSVYQAKMSAMRRISHLEPPNELNYKIDTMIVEFYRSWAKEKGYLK